MAHGLAEIGDQLIERYGRQGYEVGEGRLTPTRQGWLFEAALYAGGIRSTVTATGRMLEITSETINRPDSAFDGLYPRTA